MEWPIFHTSLYGSRVWKCYSKRVVDYTFPNTILENAKTVETFTVTNKQFPIKKTTDLYPIFCLFKKKTPLLSFF